MILALVLVLLALGVTAAFVALRMRRRRESAAPPRPNWTHAAGSEFERLSAAQRCDLVFAVAALEGESSKGLLTLALGDPSEAVALAAARALVRQADSATFEQSLAQCSPERAQALRLLVEILN